MNPIDPRQIKFGGPAKYRIIVQGTVDDLWSDRLGGMSITCSTEGETNERTTLAGWIHDQAELKGVLDTLYGLHCPIIHVDVIHDSN